MPVIRLDKLITTISSIAFVSMIIGYIGGYGAGKSDEFDRFMKGRVHIKNIKETDNE